MNSTKDTTERTEATHTPGPWRQQVLLVQDERGDQIAHCTRWIHGTPMPEIAEANARLIAAAPDLLEAVRDLLSLYTTFDRANLADLTGRFDAARAAVAKAEGR